MNTKGVEDGIVCEFCGIHCYQGAEHHARVEDNARFDDPKPNGIAKIFGAWPGDETDAELLSALDGVRGRSVPVEERTADGKGPHACMHSWGHCASARKPHMCCQIKSHNADHSCTYCEARPIPEERTAEMAEPSLLPSSADLDSVAEENRVRILTGDRWQHIRPQADASAEAWKSFAFTLEEALGQKEMECGS